MADDAKTSETCNGRNLPLNCHVCGAGTNLKRCAKCKQVLYCSREHQISDWKKHKLVCNSNGSGVVVSSATQIPDQKGTTFKDQHTTNLEPKKTEEEYFDNSKFDERPYKTCEFPKPKSYEYPDLSKHIGTYLKQDGFCVVDGILSEDEVARVTGEVRALDDDGKLSTGKLGGGRSSGDNEQKVVNEDIRNDRIMWFQGDEKDLSCPAIYGLLADKMDLIVGGLNAHLDKTCCINGRTKAMIACYPGDGAGYKKHVDNPCKDGRIVTCICYLNKEWNPETDGGFLRVFPETKPGDYVDISPEANRMLFFWSDRRNPHEVHPSYKTRYAVTVWFFDEAERSQAKLEEVEKDIAEVNAKIVAMDEKKKKLEKITAELEISNKANHALSLLSDEEKEAILELIDACPDPSTMLSGIGIAEFIQKPLLEEARRRKSKK